MLQTAPPVHSEQIVARIDAIIRELETLRQQVLTVAAPSPEAAQQLVRELRGKYAAGGHSLTQALLDEHRTELAREAAKFQRPGHDA